MWYPTPTPTQLPALDKPILAKPFCLSRDQMAMPTLQGPQCLVNAGGISLSVPGIHLMPGSKLPYPVMGTDVGPWWSLEEGVDSLAQP